MTCTSILTALGIVMIALSAAPLTGFPAPVKGPCVESKDHFTPNYCYSGECLLYCVDDCESITYFADCENVDGPCNRNTGTGDEEICRECTCVGYCRDDGLYYSGTQSTLKCI
jgi:hypothetical protein